MLATADGVLLPGNPPLPDKLTQGVPCPRRRAALRPKDGTLFLVRLRPPFSWFEALSVGEEYVEGAQGGVREGRGARSKRENLRLLVPVARHHGEEVGILCGI